ncbi:MAG TPA: TIGR03067 domain-containing protein [Gemmataceae bacterium]|nr:TIGR03067 domain-containing protein [Gemmataceae bacterium]
MKVLCALAMLVAALLVANLNAGDTAKGGQFDAAKLVGTWKYVSGVKDGEKMDADRFKDQELVIAKDKITLKAPDATFVMKYELDSKKTPVTIKLEITEGPFGEGMKANGIIELNGDDLKFCYAPMGGEGPKAFEAKQGSGFHFFVLKRGK